MKGKILVSLGVALLLGGCSLAPLYEQPPMPVPDEWPRGEAYQSVSPDVSVSQAANLSWRSFFAGAQLPKIIEMALEKNRDLRIAILSMERARAIYGIQGAGLLPSVNASAEASKKRMSADLVNHGEPRKREQYSLDLGIIAWEIDFFGRIRSLEAQALEEYLATDEARRGAQVALIAEIARTWLTLAADRENLKLAKATLENQQAASGLVQKLFDNGLAAELDLLRAQTPIEAARGEVARFTQLVAQDQNALNLLAGAPVPEDLLPQDLTSVPQPPTVSPGLPSETLLRRPDILAAEHRLKGANAFIGAARAAFFPQISLTALAGTASNDLSGLFSAGTETWSFIPKIGMSVFDTRVWTAYRVSKTDQDLVLTRYEKVIQTAFREVADVLAAQGTIDERLSAQQALLDKAAETNRLAEKRFANGIDNYLGVLDAQRAQFSAQQGLVALRLAKLANRVQLYAVLGGGGDEPVEPAEQQDSKRPEG